MALYEIKSIRHSGRFGTRGNERMDGRYPKRVGRIVRNIPLDKNSIGTPLTLEYVKDEHGNNYSGYFLHCSVITSIHNIFGESVCIETLNTIYEFEKLESEEK